MCVKVCGSSEELLEALAATWPDLRYTNTHERVH